MYHICLVKQEHLWTVGILLEMKLWKSDLIQIFCRTCQISEEELNANEEDLFAAKPERMISFSNWEVLVYFSKKLYYIVRMLAEEGPLVCKAEVFAYSWKFR